jgi:iron complex transport system substrate-binding protein
LQPDSLACIEDDIRRTATALGVPGRGEELVRRMRDQMDQVARRASSPGRRPRVACIEWIDPLMAAGNWTPELVQLAGGENLFGEAGRHAPLLNWDRLREADPELLVVAPCGFDITRTAAEMPSLVRRPGWDSLAAVRSGQVYLADGNQFFNRPGPRTVEALEILAELLHPGVFPPRHEGTGWRRWPANDGRGTQ